MAHPYAARLGAVVAATTLTACSARSSPLGPVFDADPEKAPLGRAWALGVQRALDGAQYWRLNAIRPVLHSELGAPARASLEPQRRFLSPRYWGRPGSPARRHHGGAWWDHQDTVGPRFGPIADEALAVLASQWLQAEALRYYIERPAAAGRTVSGSIPGN